MKMFNKQIIICPNCLNQTKYIKNSNKNKHIVCVNCKNLFEIDLQIKNKNIIYKYNYTPNKSALTLFGNLSLNYSMLVDLSKLNFDIKIKSPFMNVDLNSFHIDLYKSYDRLNSLLVFK